MAKYWFPRLVGILGLRLVATAPLHDGLEARNFLAEASLSVTDNYHPLVRIPVDPEALKTSRFQDVLQDDIHVRQLSVGTDYIKAIPLQTQYLMQVGIGGSNWSMIPDTGSSDTWLMSSTFECLDASFHQQNQTYCDFGPPYNGTFSGGKINDQHMNISYANGASLNGPMGFSEYVSIR
jgi:hypothetical protein